MEFNSEMASLVIELQGQFPHLRFTSDENSKGRIKVAASLDGGDIALKDFHDIVAFVEQFCQSRNFNYKKESGFIYWWKGKRYYYYSEYQNGVGFHIYIDEK